MAFKSLAPLLKKDLQDFKAAKPKIVAEIANSSKNFFTAGFRKQGFHDATVKPWRPRKKKDSGRAILVKSGRLSRSIRVVSRSSSRAILASNLPYSAVHNEGLGKMPQRKFMGNSKELNRKMRRLVAKRVGKALRK